VAEQIEGIVVLGRASEFAALGPAGSLELRRCGPR
jgi:hypothetical protein